MHDWERYDYAIKHLTDPNAIRNVKDLPQVYSDDIGNVRRADNNEILVPVDKIHPMGSRLTEDQFNDVMKKGTTDYRQRV